MTFVILAAGLGTRIGRVGESLHKALVPLGDKAVLTRLISQAPRGAHIVICLGHRGTQIRDFVGIAHPSAPITFVEVQGWNDPGGGPGRSLTAAKSYVKGDLLFTSCDTLWANEWLPTGSSWMGVAPVPPGTEPERWCRAECSGGPVTAIYDKRPGGVVTKAYTGVSFIKAEDLEVFWRGLPSGMLGQELQVTGGLSALVGLAKLGAYDIEWTDVGDEQSYRQAVARFSGYDWTKIGQATYVMPEENIVVKFFENVETTARRVRRAKHLGDVIPQPVIQRRQFMVYPYVGGMSGYDAAQRAGLKFAEWMSDWVDERERISAPTPKIHDVMMRFYRDKTFERTRMLPNGLRRIAEDAVNRVNWEQLLEGFVPAMIHGDLNYGNIIVTGDGTVVRGIDWREDFAGEMWGDLRYDQAKLLAGCVVHWENARRGDFRPWPIGRDHVELYLREWEQPKDVEVIAALSLINSAPLHASPLDEILVARGAAWLGSLT